jgi:hypothetical protein
MSEHCVGFLKGCWLSLQGLQVHINNKKDIQFAALWITACINLHAFAMDHEVDMYVTRDVFYQNGLKIARKEHRAKAARERRRLEEEYDAGNEEDENMELLEGKLQLKEDLFIYLDDAQ